MISKDDIIALVNAHLSRVLRLAELALSPEQFAHFRSLTLREFGRDGFRRGLARLLDHQQDNNKKGSGWQKSAGKEV